MTRTPYSDAETKDLIMFVGERYQTICCTGKEFDKVAAKQKWYGQDSRNCPYQMDGWKDKGGQ